MNVLAIVLIAVIVVAAFAVNNIINTASLNARITELFTDHAVSSDKHTGQRIIDAVGRWETPGSIPIPTDPSNTHTLLAYVRTVLGDDVNDQIEHYRTRPRDIVAARQLAHAVSKAIANRHRVQMWMQLRGLPSIPYVT